MSKRIEILDIPKTRMAACECGRRVGFTVAQLNAGWDATKRLEMRDLAYQFVQGGISGVEDVEEACGIILSDVKDNLELAVNDIRENDLDSAGGKISMSISKLQTRLRECSSPER